jgi:DNA-binding transcriptional LysR family regulator
MQLAGTEAVKKAVESNLGLAMVSRYAVERELELGALTQIPIDGLTIERPIHVLHRKDKRLTPLAEAFVEFATDYAGSVPS